MLGLRPGLLDDADDLFVTDVALGRRTSPGVVKRGYGEGRMVTAREAVKTRLADRVGTLERVVSEIARPVEKRDAMFAIDRKRYRRSRPTSPLPSRR